MNFSKLGLGRQLAENVDPLEVAQGTRDNALTGGERQQQGTANLKQKQRQQLSLNKKPTKSDVTYATEGKTQMNVSAYSKGRRKAEIYKLRYRAKPSDWRKDLKKGKNDKDKDKDKKDKKEKKTPASVLYGRKPTREDRVTRNVPRSTAQSRLALGEAIEDNDQAMHPFVDVMPPTVKREKLMLGQGAKAAKDKKKNLEPSAPQAEAVSFEDALQDLMEVTGLVDKSKPVAGTRYNRPYRTPVGEVKAMKKAQVKGNASDT